MTDSAERYVYAADGTDSADIFKLLRDACNGGGPEAEVFYKSIEAAATDFMSKGKDPSPLNVYRIVIEKVEKQ